MHTRIAARHHRAHGAAPELDLGGARLDLVRKELVRRRGQIGSAPGPQADHDARTRQGAADLLLALEETRPRLAFLHALSDPAGFLGGANTGARAVALVTTARGLLAASRRRSPAYPGGAAGLGLRDLRRDDLLT